MGAGPSGSSRALHVGAHLSRGEQEALAVAARPRHSPPTVLDAITPTSDPSLGQVQLRADPKILAKLRRGRPSGTSAASRTHGRWLRCARGHGACARPKGADGVITMCELGSLPDERRCASS